jgi:hypothetical protein
MSRNHVEIPKQDALLIVHEPDKATRSAAGDTDEPIGEAETARRASRHSAMEIGVRQK